MGDKDNSADDSRDRELGHAIADGSETRLAPDDCDPLGHVTTYRYCCDPGPIRLSKRKRSGPDSGKKARASHKPGPDGLEVSRPGHFGARNQSSAGGT
jgi:hypothetical protein